MEQGGLAASGMRGSRDNLKASKADLSGGLSSKHGSLRNLAGIKGGAAPPTAGGTAADQAPTTNAPMYENTYKMKPDKK
jgi:hypothetical protein